MISIDNKPDFFLVGAAKAGTTSLYNYLDQHPDIYMSPVKEPNFFSTDINVDDFCSTYRKNTFLENDNYFNDRPLKPLQLAFIRKKGQYDALFEPAGRNKIKGEASTSYLFSQVAAKNIYGCNPNAKIIIIIRNPVERIFSHYLMALRYGFTHLSFKKALEKDMQHPDKGWGKSELFVELGMYYEQIKRYFDIFSADKVKIFLFDELKNAPERLMSACFEFLEVKNISFKSFSEHNKALVPGHSRMNTFLVKTGAKNVIKSLVSENMKKRLKNIFYNEKFPVMSDFEKVYVKKLYAENVTKTAELINKDLSHWLK